MSGNSEVGHLTFGAGQIVPSVQSQVAQRMACNELGKESVFQDHLATLARTGGALHLVGLLSDGGVHSDHRAAHILCRAAQRAGVAVYLHAILDGRDVGQRTARGFLDAYESSGGVIASIHGRWFAMDRDEQWDRIAQSYACMTSDSQAVDSWQQVLELHYAAGHTDETVIPTLVHAHAHIKDGDGVLFFNVRPDRARQLTQAFMQSDFSGFSRTRINLECFITLGHFDTTFDSWGVQPLVEPLLPKTTLLAQLQRQFPLRRTTCIAESEKRAHVTYFFDGRSDTPRPEVQYHIVRSPVADSFDQVPEMAAEQITQSIKDLLDANKADTFIVNMLMQIWLDTLVICWQRCALVKCSMPNLRYYIKKLWSNGVVQLFLLLIMAMQKRCLPIRQSRAQLILLTMFPSCSWDRMRMLVC